MRVAVIAAAVLAAACASTRGPELLPDGGIVCPDSPDAAVYCGNVCPSADTIVRRTVCGTSLDPVDCDGGTAPTWTRVSCLCNGLGGFVYDDTTDRTLCSAHALSWVQIQCHRDGG